MKAEKRGKVSAYYMSFAGLLARCFGVIFDRGKSVKGKV